MTETDTYRRFERVDGVEETPRGLLASLHGEQLRVDVVREDVVRVKISRGGRFDEQPTYAVCVDPLEGEVGFAVERGDGAVRLRTEALVLSLHLDPFRLDVHRPDGTPVVETAQDPQGRYWAYATLNDAFTVRRRCRQTSRSRVATASISCCACSTVTPSRSRVTTVSQGASRAKSPMFVGSTPQASTFVGIPASAGR